MDKETFIAKLKSLGFDVTPEDGSFRGEVFIIQNFFFGVHRQDTQIMFLDDVWKIKNYEDIWAPIHSPEELITYNYYEFYLPKKRQYPDFSIPSDWEDRFSSAGLNYENEVERNLEFQKARRSTLLKKVEDHFSREEGLKDMDFWEELAKEFPECVYMGEVYRAVLTHPDDLSLKKLVKPGYSWSLSLDGIRQFVNLGDSYPIKHDPGFVLFKGVIRGISLVHIIKLLGEDYKRLVGHTASSFVDEEEVIALEVLSHSEGQYLKYVDIKKGEE